MIQGYIEGLGLNTNYTGQAIADTSSFPFFPDPATSIRNELLAQNGHEDKLNGDIAIAMSNLPLMVNHSQFTLALSSDWSRQPRAGPLKYSCSAQSVFRLADALGENRLFRWTFEVSTHLDMQNAMDFGKQLTASVPPYDTSFYQDMSGSAMSELRQHLTDLNRVDWNAPITIWTTWGKYLQTRNADSRSAPVVPSRDLLLVWGELTLSLVSPGLEIQQAGPSDWDGRRTQHSLMRSAAKRGHQAGPFGSLNTQEVGLGAWNSNHQQCSSLIGCSYSQDAESSSSVSNQEASPSAWNSAHLQRSVLYRSGSYSQEAESSTSGNNQKVSPRAWNAADQQCSSLIGCDHYSQEAESSSSVHNEEAAPRAWNSTHLQCSSLNGWNHHSQEAEFSSLVNNPYPGPSGWVASHTPSSFPRETSWSSQEAESTGWAGSQLAAPSGWLISEEGGSSGWGEVQTQRSFLHGLPGG